MGEVGAKETDVEDRKMWRMMKLILNNSLKLKKYNTFEIHKC